MLDIHRWCCCLLFATAQLRPWPAQAGWLAGWSALLCGGRHACRSAARRNIERIEYSVLRFRRAAPHRNNVQPTKPETKKKKKHVVKEKSQEIRKGKNYRNMGETKITWFSVNSSLSSLPPPPPHPFTAYTPASATGGSAQGRWRRKCTCPVPGCAVQGPSGTRSPATCTPVPTGPQGGPRPPRSPRWAAWALRWTKTAAWPPSSPSAPRGGTR